MSAAEPPASRSRVSGRGEGSSGASRRRAQPADSSRVPATERLLNLIAFLLRSRRPVSVAEILAKVHGYDDEVHPDSLRRRFERDKKTLRVLGLPLELSSLADSEEGYRIPPESYALGPMDLPAESRALLRVIAAATAPGFQGSLRDDLRAALIKLGFDAEPQSDSPRQSLTGRVFDLKLDSSAAPIEVLSEAILRRCRVRFRYYTISRDAEGERLVDPYGLGYTGQSWHQGAWYLVGWCHSRQAQRVFKLTRIRGEVTIESSLGAEFERPADFDVAQAILRPPWEQQGHALASAEGQALEARVRVDLALVPELSELLPLSRIEAGAGESADLRLTVESREPLLRFLLRYSGRAEILEPESLKADLRQLATRLMARYHGAAGEGEHG